MAELNFAKNFIFFLAVITFLFLFFSAVFYANSLIIAHHMSGSNLGIRGYTNFHYPRPTSLYSYDDEERTNLIRIGSTQTLRELVTSISF